MQEFITNYLAAQGIDVDQRLDELARRYGTAAPNEDVLREELVCQTVMAIAADENAFDKAVRTKENAHLLEKVRDALKGIAQRIRDFFNGIADGGRIKHNKEAAAMLDDADALDRMAEKISTLLDKGREVRAETGDVESGERYAKKPLKFTVFPPYNESKSDANTLATRWANNPNVKAGDWKLAFYHQECYIIEKFDDSMYKYQIVDFVPQDEIEKYNRIWREQYDRNREESMDRRYSGLSDRYREAAQHGEKRSDFNDDVSEHPRKSNEVRGMGKSKNGRWQGEVNTRGGAVSSNTDRQGHGTAGLEGDSSDGLYALDDSYTDDYSIEDVLWGNSDGELYFDSGEFDGDDSADYADSGSIASRLAEADPYEAIDRIYNASAHTAERAIKGYKMVELEKDDYRKVARNVMKTFGISEKRNPGFADEFAERIESFITTMSKTKHSEFSVDAAELI